MHYCPQIVKHPVHNENLIILKEITIYGTICSFSLMEQIDEN
jgi:hypothetical protein